MRTVTFRFAHLAAMRLGAEERAEHTRMGEGLFDALYRWPGPAWSLIDGGGTILGCFGMLLAKRDGIVWAVLSDDARANRFGLCRAARRQLEHVEQMMLADHIYAAVRKGYAPGRRWLQHLDFRHDGDFQAGSQQYERYRKWPAPQQ